MLVKQLQKSNTKKYNRKNVHDFSAKVKQKEFEDAKGICRTCRAEPITQYHHINEKGMGGGRGLGIQINCLGVGDRCHNHDDTKFLKQAEGILIQRIETLFQPNAAYITAELEEWLNTDFETIFRQVQKGFLKSQISTTGHAVSTTEDIKRWLGVA